MPTDILMPALSPTMTEGTLARWLKKEGDAIRSGDVIAEIETDKATMEVEAADDGILGEILVPDGTEGVKVNEPIARLRDGSGTDRDEEEDEPAPAPAAAPAKAEAPADAEPKPKPAAAPAAKPAAAPAPERAEKAERIAVSPLARRMAEQAGVDLARVTGSGPDGRIVKADIEALAGRAGGGTSGAAPAAAAAAKPPASAQGPAILEKHTLLPQSPMRRTIARRLTEAKQTIPHFYVSVDVELDALLALRAKLNALAPAEGPGAFKLSVNDMLIKATALTLRQVPELNALWTPEGVARLEAVDISIAVSVPDGLQTPILRAADTKGLAAISSETKALAERARQGKLKPEEYQGGGFSISNMGMHGVTAFAAIINPPQAAILALSSGIQKPVVHDGALAIATVMTCTLSVDHRVADGVIGAAWLSAFRAIVETPLSLML